MKNLRKELTKRRKSKKYIFVMENKGYKVDGIKDTSIIRGRVLKDMIKHYPLVGLEKLIVVKI